MLVSFSLLISACNTSQSFQSLESIDPGVLEDVETLPTPDRGSIFSTQGFNDIVATPEAYTKGAWSEVLPWPINAIHSILLPDGNVLTYGSDATGRQGAQLIYDVWNPNQGFSLAAHDTLSNTTGTDIFCSAQALLPETGQVLITGGDLIVNGKRNYSNNDINFFDYRDMSLTKSPLQLTFGRWYPTLTTLASGDMLLHGGRSAPGEPVLTPEVYSPATDSWRLLTNAENEAAYGDSKYWYPWSFVTPSGKVLITGKDPDMWLLDTEGTGSISHAGVRDGIRRFAGSAVLYDEGKILVMGGGSGTATNTAVMIDANSDIPIVTATNNMNFARTEVDATLLPNGQVLATGGSAQRNELVDVAYTAEIWDPATEQWTLGASASKPRLYHSSAILLPNGTVLTSGGGTPGPVLNLNSEIYYPPYLFDSEGQLAKRPRISSAPSTTSYAQSFNVRLATGKKISRVSLVRMGSATHNWNMEQRFVELDFSKKSKRLSVQSPSRPELAPPGYYMLFALDANGVPSEAHMIKLENEPL